MSKTQKITPCLWYDGKAEEAANFYVSLFPDSKIDKIHRSRSDTPGVKKDGVLLVTFSLAGQKYMALNGGPYATFNDAISMSVDCEDQAEVDRLWSAMTTDGGRPVQCGWLKDKYGMSWQIVPRRLPELLQSSDPAVGARVMAAMMGMVKIDVAALEAAARG